MPDPITPTDAQLPAMRRWFHAAFIAATLVYLGAWALYLARAPFALSLAVTSLVIVAECVAAIRFRKRFALSREHQLVLPYPHNLEHTLAQSLLAALPIVLIQLLGYRNPASVAFLLAMPAFCLGASLFVFALTAREPAPPSCPTCAYDLEGFTFPAMCPECAHPLPNINATTTTPRVRRPRFVWGGLTLSVAALSLMFALILKPAFLFTNLPRTARLALAPTTREVFRTINPATLSPAERDALIDAILAARATHQRYEIRDQLDWLGSQFVSGSLTPAQADALAADTYELAITTDAPPRVGQPLRISLTGRPPLHASEPGYAYFVRSFTVNDEPLLLHDHTVYNADDLEEDWPNRDHTAQRTPPDQPTVTCTPTSPAPLRIRAEIVLITHPRAARTHAIAWLDNGFTVTPAPLTTHERTVEAAPEVRP